METKQIETQISRWVPSDGGDFERTQSHEFTIQEALEELGEQLEEAGLDRALANRFKIVRAPRFLYFDSTNPSHASGFFSVRFEGPSEYVEALESFLDSQDRPPN